jgi:uncharacterized membrane protein (UPF0127 family)
MSPVRAAVLAGCALAVSAGVGVVPVLTASPAVAGVELFVTTGELERCHCVALADSEEERNLGLTPDGDPAPLAAMVFAWPHPQQVSFWMQDTAGPLDVAFVDTAGVVVDVSTMTSCRDDCPVFTSSIPVALAIEAPSVERLGIVRGALVRVGSNCEV